jgi:hypothetical protein
MPKIFLKPNSPEFDDGQNKPRSPRHRTCDMPDCVAHGEYRAPKDRALSDYYWFCLPHVQEYNKAWNYFSGMSMSEVEDYINTATVWDRPTRRYDTVGATTEALKMKAWQTYNFTDDAPPRQEEKASNPSRQTPEFEALAMMGLEPPVTLDDVKKKYKILAKKYHPDTNGSNPDSEELLKKINMAYTILKMAYQKFEKLEK